MAITSDTIAAIGELRLLVDTTVDGETARLVAAWARAWDTLIAQWDTAIHQAAALDAAASDILSLDRVAVALDATAAQLTRLVGNSETDGVAAATKLADAAPQAQSIIIASQYPTEAGPNLAVSFNRFDLDALQAIVERTSEQITSLSAPLTAEAEDAMKRALINGIVLGQSPRDVANSILANVEGGFNGGLNRALTISRTEILDAYRSSANGNMAANADVLAGWMWTAELDDLTCPSCWAMDGQMFPVTEPGPYDHPNGRCAATPITKSWADLGFDVEEPDDARPDAQSIFDNLSEEQQLAIMGPTRLAGLQDGSIAWADLSTRVSNDGWRDAYQVTPVGQLIAG